MAVENERKFLVVGSEWRRQVLSRHRIRQAYLAQTELAVIRVRIVDGALAFLTIKTAKPGISRNEFEYSIPVKDAEAILSLRTGLLIEKQRHIVPAGSLAWEVDEFEGAHKGLLVAEIELPSADTPFARPEWLGAEVTGDARYYNANLTTCIPKIV